MSTQVGDFSFTPRWQQLEDQVKGDVWDEVLANLELRDRLLEHYLSISTVPIGAIQAWAGQSSATIPNGWRVCDGSAVSRAAFSALFKVIGTTYGVGDGSTTFNLPNLQGRFPVGQSGAPFATLGGTGGSANAIVVTHNHGNTDGESATHIHGPGGGGQFVTTTAGGGIYAGGIGGSGANSTAANSPGHVHGTNDAGSSGTNANLPPYLVIRYLIRA